MNPRTSIAIQRWQHIDRALSSKLPLPERVTLIALIQRIRTSGKQVAQTWVRVDHLAKELSVNERTIRRHLDTLEREGHIQRWRNPRGYIYRVPPLWNEIASDRAAKITRQSSRENV